MVNTLKKLEDKLLELGETLASPPSSIDELYSLLDLTDGFLSRVEQSPSPSMWKALQPLMKALSGKEFLRHPDMDIRVAVASCISEITRITAPDAPYDDDIMKEIFELIVGAFEGLSDKSSRSFQKRVSILETVAKVRSCVVMLDLECDALILDMFHHFLKTISVDHSENVFSSMETIMTLVIEESEDISSELLSGLLNALKRDRKDVVPISQRLAEKVMGNCANKIKSCLLELLESTHAPLSEFNEVVASICQKDPEETQAYGDDLEDDGKLSERTVSDELPQASAKLEQEVGCPEKGGTSADISPMAAMSNGTVQMETGDSMEQPSFPNPKPERSRRNGKSKNAVSDRADFDNVDNPDSRTDTKKAKGRKTKFTVQLTDTAVSSVVDDNHKDHPTMASTRKVHSNDSESSQVNEASTKEEEPVVSVDPEKKSEDNPTSVGSPITSLPNSSRNRRGRRSGSKAASNICDAGAAALQPALPDLKDPSGNSEKVDGDVPLKSDESKEAEDGDDAVPPGVMSDSEVKTPRNSGKMGRSKRKVDSEYSGKKQKSNYKKQRKESILGNDVDEGQSLKEMASSLKASSLKTHRMDQTHLGVSAKTKSRRKHTLGNVDMSETPDHKKEPDGSLVGSKIKVWWPDDKMFYDGVVSSYDPNTKKHKIEYTDGDVEILLLKDERYEFAEIDSEKGKRKTKGSAAPTSSAKKTKERFNAMSNQAKSQTQSTSGTESSSKDTPKPRGRPRSGISNLGKLSYDESSETLRNSKGQDASNDKAKTHKCSGKLKDDREDENRKTSSKQEESGNKFKDRKKIKGKDNDTGNDKVRTSKSSEKLENDSGEDTLRTSNHGEQSGNKSKDERKLEGKGTGNDKAKVSKSSGKLGDDSEEDAPKDNNKWEESGNKSNAETSKSVKKSKNETPKASTKARDDAPKSGGGSGTSKIGDDKSKSKDSTARIVNRTEDLEIVRSKTPKTKTKTMSSTPKTGSDSKENGMSSEGKTKVGESENADTEPMTGAKKRKRKGRK